MSPRILQSICLDILRNRGASEDECSGNSSKKLHASWAGISRNIAEGPWTELKHNAERETSCGEPNAIHNMLHTCVVFGRFHVCELLSLARLLCIVLRL